MVARCIYELVNHAGHETANIEDLSLAAECWLPDEVCLIEKWSSKVEDGFFWRLLPVAGEGMACARAACA